VPDVGETLARRYKLLNLLGRGGMADVYRALDKERSAEVAIKGLREDYAEEPEFIKRFTKEVQALAELYLSVLCEGLLHGATCGQLAGDDVAAGEACQDYSTWYVRSDDKLYRLRGEEAFVQERSAIVRGELADRRPEAEELLAGILDGGRLACAARFPRYQDVRLASTGALRWRVTCRPMSGRAVTGRGSTPRPPPAWRRGRGERRR